MRTWLTLATFIFLATMAANRPWLAGDVVAIPKATHPLPKNLEKLLPKFDLNNDVTQEDHIKKSCFRLDY